MQVSSRIEPADADRSGRSQPLLHELFTAQVKQRPGEIAVICDQEQITYEDLEVRSNRLAHRLQQLGVGPESLVGLFLERGTDMVVAILAVLKAGGAYLPIDVEYPGARIRFILDDAKPLLVCTEERLAPLLPPDVRKLLPAEANSGATGSSSLEAPPCGAAGDNAAYVIYTSGSTGEPKGVVVTHSNVVRLFSSTARWFRFSSTDVWTLFHSFAFDFSVWEMWGALSSGGKLVVVPFLVSRSPEVFHRLLVRERVTVLNQTPSAFRQLIWADQLSNESNQLSLRWVIFGGEALDLQMLNPWFKKHGDSQPHLVNMYGITETTVHVTYRPISQQDVESGRGSVIGQPLPDLVIRILDPAGRPCPSGMAGEIYVGGAGVARGYLGRPELTRERFLGNSPDGVLRGRYYRSGDLARLLPDGDIEYLGRIDNQVKVRGFRIELGEVEHALLRHPSVRECAIEAANGRGAEKHLVGYLVSQPPRPTVEELRAFLKQTLPHYMIPARFVFLDHLPLTAHGKLDRQALPRSEGLRAHLGQDFAPPLTAEQAALAAIWERVLQIDRVGLHDNFFALGGDSIKSIQVLAETRAQGIPVSLEQLFEHPTIDALAQTRTGHDVDELGDRSSPFAFVSKADSVRIPEFIEDAYPMAKLQIGMVYHSRRHPKSAVFHDVFSFGFRLPFDERKLRQAVERLTARHSIYRTAFDLGSFSEPLQLVQRDVRVPLSVDDLRRQRTGEQRAALLTWIEAEKRRPFHWDEPPFLRLHVQRYADDLFQFIVSFHHSIMDGWSLAAMLTELFRDYSRLLDGRAEGARTLPVSYRDFVRLERKAIDSSATRDFWKRKLEKPTIWTLPRWPVSLRKGGSEQVRGPESCISEEVLRRLLALANHLGVPLRSVLLAAHCRVMGLVGGQEDVLTGLVSNGRPQTEGGEQLVGLFLNTLPFRLSLSGGTWSQLVAQTFVVERELIPHRRLPLSEIQQLMGGHALFETVFDFVQFHVYRDLPGYDQRGFLEDHYFEANNFAFYVTFMLDASGNALQMHCDYDPAELCEEQIKALCNYYVKTLEAMADSPEGRYETHSPMSAEERERFLVTWNQTAGPIPDCCVHELIAAQASRTPQAIAAVFDDQSLSYAELEQYAATLARRLEALGVRPGTLVGIHIERSLEMLIALLGVLKAGGAYVPLDPRYPGERLKCMSEDAQLQIVLTREMVADALPCSPSGQVRRPAARQFPVTGNHPSAQRSDAPLQGGACRPAEERPEHLAYVIYTSGSTGKPKGVRVSHRALVNLLCAMRREPGLAADDALFAVTTLSFDIAALELFLPLTVGARVVIAPRNAVLDPALLAAELDRHSATVLQATPTAWNTLVESGWQGRKGLKALCGGEPLTRLLANRLLDRCAEVWNMYGPTETTVWSCIYRVRQGDGPVPIGRPIANTEVYVLDPRHNLVPLGTQGELYIGGAGLAEGYLSSPELTEHRFIPHPFRPGGGARLYRTGDMGCHLPNGALLCLGRSDHQVKIRGFRVELGEVESVLAQHPAVTGSVAVARDDGSRGKKLVGYYTLRRPGQATAGAIREFLESKLPPQMVPSALLELSEIPLTLNGKVDRSRLPETLNLRQSHVDCIAPRTPLEWKIAAIWKEVLQVDEIGIQDNFFDLGGHSLLAMQAIARVGHEFQVDLNPVALFEKPHLEEFVLYLMTALLERDGVWPPEVERVPIGIPPDPQAVVPGGPNSAPGQDANGPGPQEDV
jgi:amino acid adenylation domain-containing protein